MSHVCHCSGKAPVTPRSIVTKFLCLEASRVDIEGFRVLLIFVKCVRTENRLLKRRACFEIRCIPSAQHTRYRNVLLRCPISTGGDVFSTERSGVDDLALVETRKTRRRRRRRYPNRARRRSLHMMQHVVLTLPRLIVAVEGIVKCVKCEKHRLIHFRHYSASSSAFSVLTSSSSEDMSSTRVARLAPGVLAIRFNRSCSKRSVHFEHLWTEHKEGRNGDQVPA